MISAFNIHKVLMYESFLTVRLDAKLLIWILWDCEDVTFELLYFLCWPLPQLFDRSYLWTSEFFCLIWLPQTSSSKFDHFVFSIWLMFFQIFKSVSFLLFPFPFSNKFLYTLQVFVGGISRTISSEMVRPNNVSKPFLN